MLSATFDGADLPLLIGHRGIPSLAPENTLGGVRKAHTLGTRWVELDTTLLADGTPVINHDADLDRLSDRSGVLHELNLQDLIGVDTAVHFSGWPCSEPVPTLAEMLALLASLDMGLNLEIKDHGLDAAYVVNRLAPVLNSFDADRLLISSFSEALLQQCRLQLPNIRIGLLVERLEAGWVERVKALGLFSLHCDWKGLDADILERAKALGLRVLCWTVNDRDVGMQLLARGVDGLITDCPQVFAPLVRGGDTALLSTETEAVAYEAQ
ncbi:Glycerophosphoryl diester phosphodiesterase [Marinobacterium lacunae]|uniref:Glycerophosphoryl diester phosphodiesterase n=1 Tax=Marinobacterium lacunae TaxID=1232683 RepID=A0A081G1T4_9GAMM|nr:glycerophosphodiester phosphodiesterase family protein [Marinobacterium lacunae]KEA64739.1 Glycerophosphoryl diester phosphodiesterase [Marinobacterium lacunae]